MHTVPDTTESAGQFLSGLAPCAAAVPASSARAASPVIPHTACLITRLSSSDVARLSRSSVGMIPSPSPLVSPPLRRARQARRTPAPPRAATYLRPALSNTMGSAGTAEADEGYRAGR